MLQFLGLGTWSEDDARQANVQSLAFVGDSVHTLFIRSKVMGISDVKSGELHKMANAFVRASGQSNAVTELFEMLTEKEQDIFKRARNYKTQTQAKNANLSDYKRATAFEAVLGYLYLTGQQERLNLILQKSYEIVNKNNQNSN